MYGHLENLAPEQTEILIKFKENIRDVNKEEYNDYYLLKWLRARNFNLQKSEAMFRKNLNWRKEYQIDYILNEWNPPEVLKKYHTGGFYGHDIDGCPVYIKPTGVADIKGLLASASREDIIKYNIRDSEKVLHMNRERSLKIGKNIDQMVLIVDLKDYGMKDLYKPFVDINNQMLSIFEANYPENLKMTYVVNASMIFPIIFSIAKPFLSEETKRKTNVLGRNWKRDLLKVIDADQLPVYWGGKATDTDGNIYCESKICMGGQIPTSMYCINQELIDFNKFTSIEINRSSDFTLTFDITEIQSMIQWQYITKNCDIGFSLSCSLSNTEENKMIRPYVRVNCHLVPENDRIICNDIGTYTFTFDNKFSWIKKKKLLYLIEVTKPEKDFHEIHTSPSFVIN